MIHHQPSRRSARTVGLSVKSILFLMVCALFTSIPVLAQGVSGRIVGTVVDPTGAVIANAAITATDTETGLVSTTVTNSQGQYILNNLDPGEYTVQVARQGFTKVLSTDDVVSVNSSTVVNFTLKVGHASTTVKVTGGRPVLNLTSPAMSETIPKKMIEALPLSGNIFSQVVNTVPGSVVGVWDGAWGNAQESSSGAGALMPITAAVNGMPWSATTYTLDGVSNMELLNAFMNVTPPMDAIQEVKISTNNANPSVGTYGGAQVNAIIKSGTNHIHGSAYEYYRGDALEATPWVNQGPITEVPAVHNSPWNSNQWGGSIGGPILKNKLFYFGDFQALLLQDSGTFVKSVPTDLVRQGIFPEGPSGLYSNPIYVPNSYDPNTGTAKPWGYSQGTDLSAPGMPLGAYIGGCPSSAPVDSQCVPQADWDPVAQKILSTNDFYPKAQDQSSRSNNFSESINQPDHTYKFDIKGTYQINSRNEIFGRDSYQIRNLLQPGPTMFLGEGVNSHPRDTNAAFGWDHVISPTANNQFRVGFNRFYTLDGAPDQGTNENTVLGIPNGNNPTVQGAQGFAYMGMGEYSALGDGNWWTNAHRISNVYEVDDSYMKVLGRNTITLGEDARRMEASLTNGNYPGSGAFFFGADLTSGCSGAGNGSCSSYAGSGFASFLVGLPDSIYQGAVLNSPNNWAWLLGAYGTDTFRVNTHLTLTGALRWDVITNPIESHNRQGNFDMTTGLMDIARSGNRHPNVSNYLGGVLPNVGFAYAFNGDRSVIRGGFGMTQFTMPFGGFAGALEENYPFFNQIYAGESQGWTPWRSLTPNNQYLPANAPAGLFPVTTIAPQISSNHTIAIPAYTYVKYMAPNFRPAQEYDWSFGIGQKLTRTTSFSIRYVGTRGLHLYRTRSINAIVPGGSYQYPLASIAPQLPDDIVELQSDGFSIYHAMQAELRQNWSHGLMGRISYTWSDEKDDMNLWNPYDNKVNIGGGSDDMPNDIVGNVLYKLPFGRGQAFFSHAPSAVNKLVGGWQLSSILNIQSGTPIQVWASYDALQTNGQIWDLADKTCAHVSQVGSVNKWFDTSCYTDPKLGQLGTSGLNSARTPRYTNVDMSLAKSTPIGRNGMNLQFKLDATNALNHPHYGYPDTSIYDKLNPSGNGAYQFGAIFGSVGMPRTLQVGVHLSF